MIDFEAHAVASNPAEADDEARLVADARRDPRAFAALYHQHYHAIGRYIYRRVGDAHATEDLLSDVFLTALRRIDAYRWRGVPFRIWLYRIASHVVTRRLRRRVRVEARAAGANAADERSATTGPADVEALERLQSAMLAISPRYQTALALHYFEGLSIDQVAQVLGCRAGTVKSRLARGRAALRGLLGERGDNS